MRNASVEKAIPTSWGAALIMGALLLATLSEAALAASVRKARNCPTHADCIGAHARKTRIEADDRQMRFLDADGKTMKTRALLQATGEGDAREAVYPLDDDGGAVVTKWKPQNETMLDISHEILDSRGNAIAKIEGKDISPAVRPAPHFSYFVGWDAAVGSAGEPFVIYDAAGKELRRVDGVFCPTEVADCGGGVELAFSPSGDTVIVSVQGRGIAALARDGALLWKKEIAGWQGRRPRFFPSGDRFAISGRVTRMEMDPRVKNGTLKWEDVLKLPLEERQKLMLPKGVSSDSQALYCYTAKDGRLVWSSPGWGGVVSVHPSEDLVGAGQALGDDRFQAGLFDRDGLIRKWEIPRTKATPDLSWINRHLVLLFEEATYPAKGTKTIKARKKDGVRALHIFDSAQERPIWSKSGTARGFDFQPAAPSQFIISDEKEEALYEIQ